MITITVWLLLVTSESHYNHGNASVLAQFPTAKDCRFVAENIPNKNQVATACVQANIAVMERNNESYKIHNVRADARFEQRYF